MLGRKSSLMRLVCGAPGRRSPLAASIHDLPFGGVMISGRLPGWGQFHIFRTCAGEPVVRFFQERSDFFRTSIVERLVVILKTTLSPQHMFFVVFNVILITKTTFHAHNN